MADLGVVSPPLVVVHDLLKEYRKGQGSVRAVDGVSFEIRKGESFGLVGESGSGKSTLARLILHLEAPTEGMVTFQGHHLGALRSRELRRLRREMQIVFQDPIGSLNRRKTVQQIIEAPLEVNRVGDAERRRARVRELLEMVGLHSDHLHRYPADLSGGQAQRVGIARALALHPRFLVLDEAVSALDVSVQAQILNLLRDLRRRLDLTYLFISHDLAVVRYISSRVAVMYQGRLVEIGYRDELFGDARHPYTHELLAAIPEADPEVSQAPATVGEAIEGETVMPACRFRPRCPIGQDRDICRDVDPPLSQVSGSHRAACHFSDRSRNLLKGGQTAASTHLK